MSKDGNGTTLFIGVVIVLVVVGTPCFMIGTVTGRSLGEHKIRCEAVAKKHAEFLPQSDGSTKFHWLGDESRNDSN